MSIEITHSQIPVWRFAAVASVADLVEGQSPGSISPSSIGL